MISLRLKTTAIGAAAPFIVRLNSDFGARSSSHDSFLESVDGDELMFSGPGGIVKVSGELPDTLDGDVLLVLPERQIAHRLIRASSNHNTLLITERCDQLCVMCSQPPKSKHIDLFAYLEQAALLAPKGATIGISGGEPTLYKEQLFGMLSRVLDQRPDLSFHVLTNAQHFEPADIAVLRRFPAGSLVWGVPLYATLPELHDRIVGKVGAHAHLLDGLALLARAGAAIELRTVVMRDNLAQLPELARFVSVQVPFVLRWAIMQLENIGYARRDWPRLFADTSSEFTPVAEALDLSRSRGVKSLLYNFPLCTVPVGYRELAPSTISDWKRRYLDDCSACAARDRCGGFFEWYPEKYGFAGVHPI